MVSNRNRGGNVSTASLKSIVETAKPVLVSVPNAIRVLDGDGQAVFENKQYENMLRRSKQEIVSDTCAVICEGKSVGSVTAYHDISEINRLRQELEKVNRELRKIQTKYTFKDIIGSDPTLMYTIKIAQGAAITNATVMIRGESGVGKEIFAHAIHNTSSRRHENFVKVNCTSLPEALMESELFGYTGGAFTGALRSGKKGLFQAAHRGTLFLDEIGDISMSMQVKLLRVLQEKEFTPVGSTNPIRVDVRIICATNKPLEEMLEAGTFREDLYYRLNVFPLYIPPLRERRGDIEAIVFFLLSQYNELYRRNVKEAEPSAIELLKSQCWKGNIRELENVLSRTLINMGEDETLLRKGYLISMLDSVKTADASDARMPARENREIVVKLSEAVEETERICIQAAISRNEGDKNKAAYELGLPLRTLYYKCKKLGI